MERGHSVQDINRENIPLKRKESNELKSDMPEKVSVFSYVISELTRGYLLERDKDKFSERRQRVYTFMKTPRELEKVCVEVLKAIRVSSLFNCSNCLGALGPQKSDRYEADDKIQNVEFIIFGFFQCMDAFLFLFTFLPLRIFLALFKIITHPCGILFPRSGSVLEPAQICDILKGIILLVCFFILNYIDTSMMYHLVRGQAIVKLYVFFNMLDMADRLFSSFGQDILDALFWTATEPRDRKREHFGVLPHLLLAIIYVVIHTLLILFQATVLNVAFNSHNKALLTIMMSNNFVEIKSSLFKKIDKEFLYHISCSDVKERFHYVILLLVVFVRNMTEFSWNLEHVWVIIPDAALVLVAEMLVDWIKHAFILKFNEIPADVYRTYTKRLAEDMICNRQSRAFIDYSDLVSRRMGFTPLPLACLLVRICTKSFKISGTVGVLILVCLYLCLMTFKIFNSIILLGRACNYISKDIPESSPETQPTCEQPSTQSQTYCDQKNEDKLTMVLHDKEQKSEESFETSTERDQSNDTDNKFTEIPDKPLNIETCLSKDNEAKISVPKNIDIADPVTLNMKNDTSSFVESEGACEGSKHIDSQTSEIQHRRYSDKSDDLSPNFGTREEKYFPSFIPGDLRQRNIHKDSIEKTNLAKEKSEPNV